MDQPKYDYDLLVIGSGPAGHHAALEAARIGNMSRWPTGTSISAESACTPAPFQARPCARQRFYLSGFRQRSFYGRGYRVKAKIQIQDLMFRVSEVVKRQFQVIQDQLQRHGIDVLDGHAVFTSDPHVLEVAESDRTRRHSGENILIACGTRPARRAGVAFEAPQIYDTDEFIQVTEGEFPRTLIVVGGGVIGLEYASMAAALGSEVTVVEARPTLLQHVDYEITHTLMYHLRRSDNHQIVALLLRAQESGPEELAGIREELTKILTISVCDLDEDRISAESFQSLRAIWQIAADTVRERRELSEAG